MNKINCWEFFNCGREPGGEKGEELGICPAALSTEYDGVNDGKHGGRFCWVVAGTFCKGEVQGTYAKKLTDCIHCDFLKYVNEENGWKFILIPKNYKKSNEK